MRRPTVRHHESGNGPARCGNQPSHAYHPWMLAWPYRIGRAKAKLEELGSRESCSSEQAWRWNGKHHQRPGQQPVAVFVVYSRYVVEQGRESGSVHGGAYIVEAGVGEASKQKYGIGVVVGDVAGVSVLAEPSAAVSVADVGVGVYVDVDAGENVAVAVAVGAATVGSAIHLTLDAPPWLFVADHGRLCVLV